MASWRGGLTLGLVGAALLAAPAHAEPDRTLQLPIGDAARRTRDVPIVLDGITATDTGAVMAPADLAARLADVRLLLLGESHTSQESHRVQLRVIQALVAAGRTVMIGLEMYPYTAQTPLDQWSDGYLTEDGFVTLSEWYRHWGYNWRYYREIFVFARDHGLDMYGVNTPREVVTAVRKKGFANLTPEEAARIPPDGVDVDSADHMTFFRASIAEGDSLHGGMSDEAWKSMLSAQATWDASMGWNAVRALEASKDPKAIMVVLVGSGHVAYDVGIVRQARRWYSGGMATLIPVPVASASGDATGPVRASYANYVWGVLPEANATYPTLGISVCTGDPDRRTILQVEENSAAARAGLQAGDDLLSMDGEPLTAPDTLNRLIARKQWGDSATIVVKRGAEEKSLVAYFRRTLPAREGPAAAPADTATAKSKPKPPATRKPATHPGR